MSEKSFPKKTYSILCQNIQTIKENDRSAQSLPQLSPSSFSNCRHQLLKSKRLKTSVDPIQTQLYVFHLPSQATNLPRIDPQQLLEAQTQTQNGRYSREHRSVHMLPKLKTKIMTNRSFQKKPISMTEFVQPEQSVHKGSVKKSYEGKSFSDQKESVMKTFVRKHKNELKQKKSKEWSEITFMTKKTMFARNLNDQTQKETQEIMKGVCKKVMYSRPNRIPDKVELSDFVANYQLKDSTLQVSTLIQKTNFSVRYDPKKLLYFGELKGNVKHGYGVFITKSFIFEGYWHNNLKAKGIQITDKGTYKGNYMAGLREGTGEFLWTNGQAYSGEWYLGKKHGTGCWKATNGDTYIGQWTNGQVEGVGVHLTMNGSKYEGEFRSFLKEGKGKEYFPNGDLYQGQYKKGRPHGKGTYLWRDQTKYKGLFVNGLRSNKGILTSSDGYIYEGQFQDDLPQGFGKLKAEKGFQYEGHFKAGQKQEKGKEKIAEEKHLGMMGSNKGPIIQSKAQKIV